MEIEYQNVFAAIRENDAVAFQHALDEIDAAGKLNATISTRYANWFSGIGATLLQLTSFLRVELAQQLIERGATVDLHSACAFGDVATIERLLADDPTAIERTVDTYYPIQYAISQPTALRTLLKHGDNANRSFKKVAWFEWEDPAAEQGISDWRPVHMLALGRGNEPLVAADVLRDAGADLNAIAKPTGEAPIHISAIYDRTSLIQWFIENGCDVDSRTQDCGHNSTHGLFDTKPFAPFDGHDQTPLMIALGEGMPNAVTLLIEAGADVNAKDACGFTPLHYASAPFWQEAPDRVQLLVDHGANVAATSDDGRRPIDLANFKNYQQTVAVLQ